jgi:SAM-dependent methyltransferase
MGIIIMGKSNETPSQESLRLIDTAMTELQRIGLSDQRGWVSGYLGHGPSERLAFDFDIVKCRIPRHALVCEYGAAPFVLTKALDAYGYQVIGVDIAPGRFHSVDKLGIPIVAVDVESGNMPFPGSTFDALIVNELFEHLRLNLIFTMKEAYRILKPGGLAFVSTPNLRSLKGITNLLFRGKSYACAGNLYWEWSKINKIGHMGHVREYTEREVVDFLEEIGFKMIAVIHRGNFEPVTLKRKLGNLLLWLFPKFRPLLSVVFSK